MPKYIFEQTTLANLKPAIKKLDPLTRTDVTYWYRGEGGNPISNHHWGKPIWLAGFLEGRFDENQIHAKVQYRTDHKKRKGIYANEIYIDGYQSLGETIDNRWSGRARVHFKTNEPFKV